LSRASACALGPTARDVGEDQAFRATPKQSYGTDQDPRLENPLHTITSKHRFGLVAVQGAPYRIVDIGMRMLQPPELYRAQCFPEAVRLIGSKTSQVERKHSRISVVAMKFPMG